MDKLGFVGETVSLSDVCTKASSGFAQKDLDELEGEYPVYGASGYIKSINQYHQKKEYIAVVKDGAGIGRTMFLPAKSSIIGTMQYLLPNENILPKYLYYAVKNMHLEKYYTGATIPHIYFKDYQKEQFNLPNISRQGAVVEVLENIEKIIEKRKIQLAELDTLIKARFVEMFGDPISNDCNLNTKDMTELCEIIDGDRGKNYPTADDFSDIGYCLFLNAKNVTQSGFNFDTCMFVTKEKDELLRKGKLERGDVVLTTRGTIGNLAYYTEATPYEHVRINSGMVILRMKRGLVDEVFFIEQFKMLLKDIKDKIASGSAQPQLPISTMNKITMILPEYELQNQFADFVTQVDKLKLEVQKSLDELQTLFDSLMQQYFG